MSVLSAISGGVQAVASAVAPTSTAPATPNAKSPASPQAFARLIAKSDNTPEHHFHMQARKLSSGSSSQTASVTGTSGTSSSGGGVNITA